MAFSVGAEPRQAGIRQSRLANGGRNPTDRRPRGIRRSRPRAIRRSQPRAWRRSREIQGPGHLEAPELARSQPTEPHGPFPAERRREAPCDHIGSQIERLEEGPADVGGNGADTHPGQGLAEPGLERIEEVADCPRSVEVLGAARPGELGGEPNGKPWVYGPGPGRKGHRQGVDVEHVG
ncbi:MAG: hypothetical protein V4515_05455 [Chloroflexota bacterium]